MYPVKYLTIIKEIDDGKTCNEICSSLSISRKELYYFMQSLKNEGIDFIRKYYSDGVIKYAPVKKARDIVNTDSNTVDLITQTNGNYEKFLVISDTHLGHPKERLDLLDRVYNYARKNDIGVIFLCGDLIDGTYTKSVKERSRDEIFKQVEYFINKYPFDNNITNIAVLGDHDYSALSTYYINLKDVLMNKRHDFLIGGYNNTSVNIKNDNIHLFHSLNGGKITTNGYSPIILKGHTHAYSSAKKEDGTLEISVPSISEVMEAMPSALQLELDFRGGYIVGADVKQILFLDKDNIVSNCRYEFKRNNMEKISPVKNEEIFYEERDLMDMIAEDIAVPDTSKLLRLKNKRGE